MVYLGWQPVVELGHPILDRVDGDDAEHLLGLCALQKDVDEGHDLNEMRDTGIQKFVALNSVAELL